MTTVRGRQRVVSHLPNSFLSVRALQSRATPPPPNHNTVTGFLVGLIATQLLQLCYYLIVEYHAFLSSSVHYLDVFPAEVIKDVHDSLHRSTVSSTFCTCLQYFFQFRRPHGSPCWHFRCVVSHPRSDKDGPLHVGRLVLYHFLGKPNSLLQRRLWARRSVCIGVSTVRGVGFIVRRTAP